MHGGVGFRPPDGILPRNPRAPAPVAGRTGSVGPERHHVPAPPSSSGSRHGPPLATNPRRHHAGRARSGIATRRRRTTRTRPLLCFFPCPARLCLSGLGGSRIRPPGGPGARRRLASKRTRTRVLISRPSPPVPKNSSPPFLLALAKLLPRFLPRGREL